MKHKSLKSVLIFLILAFALCPFRPFSIMAELAKNSELEVIRLIVGQTHVVSTRSPTRVVIGSPKVADVTDVTGSEITITAKGMGTTTLVYWDALGEQAVKIKVFEEDLDEIKHRIDILLKTISATNVYTQVAEDEGKVILLGSVKTLQEKARVESIIGSLRTKTVDMIILKEETTPVEIDVMVLEMDRGSTREMGFEWPYTMTLTDVGTPITTATVGLGNVFQLSKFTRSQMTFTLDLLEQEGKIRILSRPRLACQSGKEAEMLVGGEQPNFTTTVSTTGNATSSTVEYKEYGIKLKVLPKVTEDKRVHLNVSVEVSDLEEAVTIGAANAPTGKAYPLVKRTAVTELTVDNNQTMIMGGLIKQKTEEDLQRFPWLADVPVLGTFFRHRITKKGSGAETMGDQELFISLTPTIIESKSELEIKPEKKLYPPREAQASPTPGDPLSLYTTIIQNRILSHLAYPAQAKEAGFQGTTRLGLHITYNGTLQDAVLKASSGYRILDENAINTAKKIASYPPFPPAIEAKDLWIEIPIVYTLD
jgi:TonB family protein